MLWAAADTPAFLRQQDVGRFFENAKSKHANQEHLRLWLLSHPDLLDHTRCVFETGLYEGHKAWEDEG